MTQNEQTGKSWRQVDLPYCCYYGNTNRKRTRSTSSRTSRTSFISGEKEKSEYDLRSQGSDGKSQAEAFASLSPQEGRSFENQADLAKKSDVTLVPDETLVNIPGAKDYVESYYALTPVNDHGDNNSSCGQDVENRAGMDATRMDLKLKQETGREEDTVSVESDPRTPTNLDSPTAQYEAVIAAMAALKKSKNLQQIKSLIKQKADQISEHLSPETPSNVLQRDVTVTFKMGSDNVSLMETSLTSLSRNPMETSITSLPRSSSDLSTTSSTFAWSEFGSVCGWDPTGRSLVGADMEEEDIEDEEEEYVEILDEGDIHWVWVNAGACPIKEEAEVRHWLAAEVGSNRSSSIFYHRQFTTGTWRNTILSLLKSRNKQQLEPFRHYPLAIERVRN